MRVLYLATIFLPLACASAEATALGNYLQCWAQVAAPEGAVVEPENNMPKIEASVAEASRVCHDLAMNAVDEVGTAIVVEQTRNLEAVLYTGENVGRAATLAAHEVALARSATAADQQDTPNPLTSSVRQSDGDGTPVLEFKGIELGKAYSKDTVAQAFGYDQPDYGYTSIAGIGAFYSLTFLGPELHAIALDLPAAYYGNAYNAIENKFGKPETSLASTVQNGFGAQFQQVTSTWRIGDGSIVVQRFGHKVSRSMVLFYTDRYSQSLDTQESAKLNDL